MKGWHLWLRPRRVIFSYNTNDGATLIGAAFAIEDFSAVKGDIEGNHFRAVQEVAPELAERMRAGRREERFVGGAIPNYMRKPYGPGWALVGDAGLQKDPCTASGITDAFRSAEWLAEAIDAGFSGRQPLEDALAAYAQTRDNAFLPYYELTCQLATLDPPPQELQQVLHALQGDPSQASRFFGVLAHTVPVQEFFAPENLQKIVSKARTQTANG